MDKNVKFREYFKIFLIGFALFGAAIIPSLIFTGGMWVYYGDFNVQQIPFYMHVHEAVRSGNIFYDWSTDLGGSFIGCYSFYLWGSPFFWLTIPFPTAWIPYILPWLAALKYGLMAMFAYMFARRHLKTETGAFACAFLFAFSGWQGAVLVYNHFHDFVVFFPLYLLLFERLIEEKRRLGFTFMTMLMAIINYYFFVGSAIFLVIYFFARYVAFEKNNKKNLYNFGRALLSGLVGVLLSCIVLLPGIYYTMGNSRLGDTLSGYDLIAYSSSLLPLGIIKNTVMLPDVSGLNSMLNPDMARVSGIGAYIPLFSIAGVIAFFIVNKGKHWAKILFTVCGIFAAVPLLNSMFSAFNSEYYARWFYMPVLIMAYMTAYCLERREECNEAMRIGLFCVGIVTITIVVIAVLPAKLEDGGLTILGRLKNPEQLASEIIFSTVMFLGLLFYVHKLYKKKDSITRYTVVLACFLTAITMATTGAVLVDSERKDSFIDQVIKGTSPLPDDEGFYRIETDEDAYNYPMIWGAHSVTSFISTIPDSTLEFYQMMKMPRKVTSNLWTTRVGARALLSCKYFVKDNETTIETIGRVEDMSTLKGYNEYRTTANGYTLYLNENYIPMGFTFDKYVTRSQFENSELSDQSRDKALASFLIVEDDDAEWIDFDRYMEHVEADAASAGNFALNVEARKNSACTSFTTHKRGFKATINNDRDNYVFFSVPYEAGFDAAVDGKLTDIFKADAGFMMVFVPAGEHEIEFYYTPSYFYQGMIITCLGFVILIMLILFSVMELRGTPKHPKPRGSVIGQ